MLQYTGKIAAKTQTKARKLLLLSISPFKLYCFTIYHRIHFTVALEKIARGLLVAR